MKKYEKYKKSYLSYVLYLRTYQYTQKLYHCHYRLSNVELSQPHNVFKNSKTNKT